MANSLNLCSLTIPTKLNFFGLMLFCHQGQEKKLLRIGLSIQNEVCNQLK
jgi:Asp-tRNA(Asn)/Glu-tRNA(Gln) amidotransferase A subunit family amidase